MDYFLEPGRYAYAATPTWAVAQEGDGRNGSGADLTANVSGGAVTGVTVNAGGSGYSQNTHVYFVGAGSGAVASLNVDGAGAITSVTVSNGGSGYSTAPAVQLVPGASVPATGKVEFSAVPSSGTISVCGASVSTTGVIGAASADAAANTLATNINATTAAVNSGTSPSTPQLRNFVFARGPSGGAPAGTCEIMTRAGSHQHNNDVNSNCAITTTLNNATVTQFGASGMQRGRGGVWGWLFNESAAIWPSAVAVRSYGALFSGANAGPIAGPSAGAADVVHIRANNYTYVMSRNISANNVVGNRVTTFLVDDGTVWIGDAGTLTILGMVEPGSSALYFLLNSGGSAAAIVFGARRLGRMVFKQAYSGSGSSFNVGVAGAAAATYRAVTFWNSTEGGNVGRLQFAGVGGQAGTSLRLFDCHYRSDLNDWYTLIHMQNYNGMLAEVANCVFEWTGLLAAPGTAFAVHGNQNAGGIHIFLRNCRAIGASPVPFGVTWPDWLSNTTCFLSAKNMEGFAMPSALAGLSGRYLNHASKETAWLLLQNIGANRECRLESNVGVVDWMAGQGYPTLDAYLPNGLAWSYRYRWPAASGSAIRPGDKVEILCLTKTNILAAGQRTIVLELLLDDAYDHLITAAHLAAEVTYVADADGLARSETTFAGFGAAAAALPASAASWTLNSYTGHVARKIELTTAVAVKANTEIEVSLLACREPTATQSVFVNPEVAIS